MTIDIGDYREVALQFVQQKFDLSRDAARSVMHRYEVMHGDRVINSVELPEGAVLDFVRVDGQAEDPASMVTYDGSGVLRSAPAKLFGSSLDEILENAPPDEREYLLENIKAAVERGWFVQELSREQLEHLHDYRLPGEQQMGAQAAQRVRILVLLVNFPHWNDVSPSPGPNNYDDGGDREHPLAETEGWHHPGGPLDTGNYEPSGLSSPSWSATGIDPQGGTNASVTNHPRIEYTVDGRTGTSVELQERWYDFLFNPSNPLSVTNYYYANSHGNLSIEGNRSDVVGPVNSHHILNRVPGDPVIQPGQDYAVQPGTPIIRQIGGAGIWGYSADSSQDIVGVLARSGQVRITRVEERTEEDDPDTPENEEEWEDLDLTPHPDPYERRRYIVETDGFDHDTYLRVSFSEGTVVEGFPVDAGFSLPDTLFSSDEVLGSETGNRMLSMCYYTHDHTATRSQGTFSGRPYQLAHLRSSYSSSIVDDICGTVDSARDRYPRPAPYDHDVDDHSAPNMGYFSRTPGHNYGAWISDLQDVVADHGITWSGYDSIIYVYPSDAASGADQGGTSGPWSGPHVFIPNSAVVLPSDAGLYLTAHELGHNLAGFPDLYDLDFYTNAGGNVEPPRFECSMMGPYSVMAHGGRRVDAFLKALVGWVTPIAVEEDIIGAEVSQIEGTLQEPLVYKLPGRPHYIANNVDPSEWDEYFLVENRNRTGSDYFNDISPRGLYIYHVDERFTQRDETHPLVIVEQADGLFELESKPDRQWGDLEGDPFPGSTNNRNFTQFSSPQAWSHGWLSGVGVNSAGDPSPKIEEPPDPLPGVLQPGSSTDSFSRVANISDPGPVMTADLYVVPREVIVTDGGSIQPPDADDEDGDGVLWEVKQGTKDVPVMHLHLNNSGVDPNLSQDDVELATVRVDEIGSSQDESDVDRLSLFDDTDGDGELDVEVDTRLATAVFQNQSAYFTNLNYRIPLDEERDLFVTYDISETANAISGVSVGAGMATFDYVRPEVPGAVQRRVRTTITASDDGLGDYRFPINAHLMRIEEAPDTVTVTPTSRAPVDQPAPPTVTAIEPGEEDVPILSLDFEVDHDQATISRIRVDEVGTLDAVSYVTSTKLFLDANGDGAVDAGDTLLNETTFANVGGTERASHDIQETPIVLTEGPPKSVLLTATLSEDTPLEEPPLELQFRLEAPSYITLVQAEDIVADTNFPMESDAVGTPVPNDPPPPPQDVAASVLADGTIELTWELSADDPDVGGEADVTQYNIYRSENPADFAAMTPPDALASVSAGETQFVDTSAPLGTNMYYMMRAYDGVQEGPDSNIAGPVQATDPTAPVFSDFDPAQDAENVPLDTTIAFTVTDTGSGVAIDTLVFMIDGVDVTDAEETTQSVVTGGYRLEYDPPEDYEYLQEVQVDLRVADQSGNWAPGADSYESYNFITEGPPIYSIAGVVSDEDGDPVADVRVQAGQLFDVTTADGQYEVTGLSQGTYEVRPSKDDMSFTPEVRQVTVGPSQVAINFTAAPGFDIAGVCQDGDGNPLAGATVSDGQHSTLSGSDGSWSIEDVAAGSYTVTPQLSGYVFTPPTIDVTVNATEGDATGLTFVGAIETFDVSGTVLTTDGERLSGIDVNAMQDETVVASATSGANGGYTITGLEPGTYTIRPDDEAYVFNPEESEIGVATDVSNVDFAAAAVHTVQVPAGISLMALPVDPVNPDVQAVFGTDVSVARWDPHNSPPYLTAPSNDPLMLLAPGRGFWVNSPDARTVSVAGEVYGNDQSATLSALGGWNMLGNPYDRSLPWERLQVPSGSPASAYGFIYDRAAATYRLVTTTPGLGALTSVPRNAGFWLRSSSATQVTISAPGTAAASAEVVEAAQSTPEGAWIIPIVARGAGVMDASSYAGVLPTAATMDNPPAIGPYVDVYFRDDGDARLAVDVRDSASATEVWEFAVATDMADAQVELALPDLSEVPNDRTIVLVDEDADRRMYARTMTAYTYDSGEGGARRFRLEVSERSSAGLAITAAAASATAGGAQVSYTLSADAQVEIEVLNIAGRPVATVASGQPEAAGVNSCAWNGRSTAGTLCPAGRYLVRINARADNGQQVQALVPLSLER